MTIYCGEQAGRRELVWQLVCHGRLHQVNLALFFELDDGSRGQSIRGVGMHAHELVAVRLPDWDSDEQLAHADGVGIGGIEPQAGGIERVGSSAGLHDLGHGYSLQ